MPATRSADNQVRTATLVAATHLFASRGFEGTALQDIADAVGVTKPAILHHYPSKEHIRQAVLASILEHWSQILPRLLVAATASEDRFAAVVGELVRFFATDPDRARILLREVLDRPAELRKMLRLVIHPWLSTVAGYVRTGREAGRHHADVDDEAYVVHVMQLVVTATACGPVTSSFLEHDAAERYARELTRIARSGLFSVTPQADKPARKRRSPARRAS